MAYIDKKITDLDFVSTPSSDDRVAIVNLGVTKQTSISNLIQDSLPGGATSEIQFNNGGAFGGDSRLTFDTTTGDITVNAITLGKGAGGVTSNLAVGESALDANTTGTVNTAVGFNSLTSNTTGLTNTAFGAYSLENITAGFGNVAIGSGALRNANYTGFTDGQNTALGGSAGQNITTGQKNTILGYNAKPLNAVDNNSIVIGHEASGSGDNTTSIGNDLTLNTYLKGVLHADERFVISSVATLPTGVDVGSTVVHDDGSGLKKWFTADGTNWTVDGGVTTYRENVTGATTYTITHNLNEQYPLVQTYDTATNRQLVPDTIESTGVNTLTITYAVPFTGIVIIKK